jgi:hypothetical protein
MTESNTSCTVSYAAVQLDESPALVNAINKIAAIYGTKPIGDITGATHVSWKIVNPEPTSIPWVEIKRISASTLDPTVRELLLLPDTHLAGGAALSLYHGTACRDYDIYSEEDPLKLDSIVTERGMQLHLTSGTSGYGNILMARYGAPHGWTKNMPVAIPTVRLIRSLNRRAFSSNVMLVRAQDGGELGQGSYVVRRLQNAEPYQAAIAGVPVGRWTANDKVYDVEHTHRTIDNNTPRQSIRRILQTCGAAGDCATIDLIYAKGYPSGIGGLVREQFDLSVAKTIAVLRGDEVVIYSLYPDDVKNMRARYAFNQAMTANAWKSNMMVERRHKYVEKGYTFVSGSSMEIEILKIKSTPKNALVSQPSVQE